MARPHLRTGVLATEYAVSQFRCLELSLGGGVVSRTLVSTTYFASGDSPGSTGRALPGGTYAQVGAALVFDNATFGWTGPVSGRRYRVQVVRAAGEYPYTELHVDARQYTGGGHNSGVIRIPRKPQPPCCPQAATECAPTSSARDMLSFRSARVAERHTAGQMFIRFVYVRECP